MERRRFDVEGEKSKVSTLDDKERSGEVKSGREEDEGRIQENVGKGKGMEVRKERGKFEEREGNGGRKDGS